MLIQRWIDVEVSTSKKRWKTYSVSIFRRSSKRRWNFDSRWNFDIDSTWIFQRFFIRLRKNVEKRWKFNVEILTVPAGKWRRNDPFGFQPLQHFIHEVCSSRLRHGRHWIRATMQEIVETIVTNWRLIHVNTLRYKSVVSDNWKEWKDTLTLKCDLQGVREKIVQRESASLCCSNSNCDISVTNEVAFECRLFQPIWMLQWLVHDCIIDYCYLK